MEQDYDVLIVGYSMLGNIAALLLADYNLKVLVVEKKELSDILVSKSARIDEEVMLIFEQLGLSDVLHTHLYPLKGSQLIDKKEQVLLEFNQESISDFAPLYGFYQPEIQKILQAKAAAHPNISLFIGYEVETFEQKDEGIEVYIAKTGHQDFTKINAAYLLVCNGQHSRIADYLDIEIEDFDYQSAVLCVDTIFEKDSPRQRFAQTIYDAEYPVVRISNDDKHLRWEFQIGEDHYLEKDTSEKVRNLLEELSSLKLTVESAFIYNFESRMLDKWQVNRVLIAGDAAHIMPPYLGMGLAAGIKDVYNIAWKLKLVLDELVEPTILATYQEERSPNVRSLIQLNLWIKRLFKSSKVRWIKSFVPVIPKWFLKRNLDTNNLIKSGIIGYKAKAVGQIIISPKIATHKGDIVNLNKVLERKFVLIGLGQNPVDALRPAQLEYLASIGTQFISLTSSKQKFVQDGRFAQNLFDKEGKLEEWLKRQQASFVLIRPDRIVFDAVSKVSDLNKVIDKLKQLLPLLVKEVELMD